MNKKQLSLLIIALFVFIPLLTKADTDLSSFIKFTGEAASDGSGTALRGSLRGRQWPWPLREDQGH